MVAAPGQPIIIKVAKNSTDEDKKEKRSLQTDADLHKYAVAHDLLVTVLSDPVTLHQVAINHFNEFDYDGSGFLDFGELLDLELAVFNHYNLNMVVVHEELDNRIRAYDWNQDGVLNLDEFIDFNTNLLQFMLDTTTDVLNNPGAFNWS